MQCYRIVRSWRGSHVAQTVWECHFNFVSSSFSDEPVKRRLFFISSHIKLSEVWDELILEHRNSTHAWCDQVQLILKYFYSSFPTQQSLLHTHFILAFIVSSSIQ